eukprot:NODE_308_length_10101_cov_0.990102.p4 type:complete len:354 gc:universal NODE_308_length_10101_cov_0.990102:3461-2400(-)
MMKRSTKKIKVAILFGYSGTDYYGMQIQTSVRTIEQEMLKALANAGLIAECNANDSGKVNLMRCARTDKGVHALGQVINVKLDLKSEDLQDAKVNLNLALPEAIKVWDIIRTTKGFHAKDLCSSRRYIYWLPTYILCKSDEPNDSYRVTSEIIQKFKDILQFYEGTHKFHNFTNKVKGSDAKARRHMLSLTVEEPSVFKYPTGSRSEKGEWLKILIHGQSFMLHQIRKMMALAVFIIRYDLKAETFFPWIFEENTTISIPKAPALGLMLHHPEFDTYHKKLNLLQETNTAFEERSQINFGKYLKDMDEFFETTILESMIKEELSGNDRFYQWLNYLEQETPEYIEWVFNRKQN